MKISNSQSHLVPFGIDAIIIMLLYWSSLNSNLSLFDSGPWILILLPNILANEIGPAGACLSPSCIEATSPSVNVKIET